MGSYSPDLCDMRESLHLLKTGRVKVKGLSTVYSIEELEQAIKAYIKIY